MSLQPREGQLEQTLETIQRRYGVRALHRASDAAVTTLPVCPSGLPELDAALGVGGFPRGRISELIGWGTSGMVSVAASTLAQAQRAGEQVAYIDVAAALDVECLTRCGVLLKDLVILRPRDFPHALAMLADLLAIGGVGLVVLDRVRLLALAAESAARQALEHALRECTPLLGRSQATLLCLTEPVAPGLYPPGLPLAYAASLRLELAWQEWLRRGSQVIGYISNVTVVKNKLGVSGHSVPLKIVA